MKHIITILWVASSVLNFWKFFQSSTNHDNKHCKFLNIHYFPETLNTLCLIFLISTLWTGYYYIHFIDEQTASQISFPKIAVCRREYQWSNPWLWFKRLYSHSLDFLFNGSLIWVQITQFKILQMPPTGQSPYNTRLHIFVRLTHSLYLIHT